jgi:hypothetical protein
MHKTVNLAASVPALVVSGCTIPFYYETSPVVVETRRGIVTRQLYTPELVVSDEAIPAPVGMSIPEADKISRVEGHRRESDG